MRYFALVATVLAVACASGPQFPTGGQYAWNGQGPSCLGGACNGGGWPGMGPMACDPCLGPCCSPYLPTAAPSEPPATTSKVHILLIGLTNDATIGDSVKADLKTMQDLLEKGIPGSRRYPVKVLKGDAVTAQNVLAEVDKLNVQNSEAIFCYYSGHGGYETGRSGDDSGGHYFSTDEGALFQKDLYDHLRNKRGRLTVLFTDTPYVRAPISVQAGPAVLPETVSNAVLNSLLFRFKGSVNMDGNSRDQLGWGDQKGGVFTLAFADSCNPKEYANPEFATWQQFSDRLAEATDKRFKALKKDILKNKDLRDRVGIEAIKGQPDQKPQASQMSVEF